MNQAETNGDREDFNPAIRRKSQSGFSARVFHRKEFGGASQARTSCADASTMSWVIPVTRPTIVASAG